MPRMRIDALKEGMITASDVKNLDDMLLIRAGCELSQRHIRLLRAWGVPEVTVESAGEGALDEPQPLQQMDPGKALEIETEVRGLFKDLDLNESFSQELYRLLLARKARNFASQPA